MVSTVQTVQRFPALHGWVNRILRINLSDRRISVDEVAPYVPDFLAGRGIAARIAWDEYPEPVDPFDPASPLMVFTGALTGSRSPYSGRTAVCGFSPQSYPYHFFTRSNIGAHFGGELKRAGYDGIIVTGASDTPVRILIRDDEVSILPADDLWGQDALDTIDELEAREGKGVRSLTIGQAGERLSRIATIQTASSSACGHGGFGAVMGSKKLKAISVLGSGRVSLADPERLNELTKAVGEEVRSFKHLPNPRAIEAMNARLAAEGGGSVRPYACTESCPSPCMYYYKDMPGKAFSRNWNGHWTCVGGIFQGQAEGSGGVFDWQLGMHGGMELNALTNRYGLNQWDIIVGMVPWLEACQNAGLISEVNGQPMNWRSQEFWTSFLHDMAYRQGMGDAFAEGGWRAAQVLHLGEDLVRRYYTGWGYPGHWDGHGAWCNHLVYPYWLVSALQWSTDTRDPIPSGHGYVWYMMGWTPLSKGSCTTWDEVRAIGARIYGDPESTDPYSGYNAKAYPAFYHTRRSVIKDCTPVDDFSFPLIFSPNTPDHFSRVLGIDGPAVEAHLLRAGTGVDWDENSLNTAAERVYTMERALHVRHWARDRRMDELVLPSFEYLENWQNPLLDKRYKLDREQFRPVLDEYYRLQGWDVETAWPTRERLQQLGMGNMYDTMVEGAQKAKETVPPPPAEQPVPQIND